MRVYFATKIRGFFKHLFSNSNINCEFLYSDTSIYEITGKLKMLITLLLRSRICDYLGLIKIVKCKNIKADIYASYNRFLKSDKPYFIYLENPTALYHYSLDRNKYPIGKKIIRNALNDEKLKAIVFMSYACSNTFERVCALLPNHIFRTVIYPYVPLNKRITDSFILNKCKESEFKLLYISQGSRFISKGGLEILNAFELLSHANYNISLHIITSIADLPHELFSYMNNIFGVTCSDFSYSYPELENIYATSHILLQPSSDDSSPLTILEAMKSGLPVLASCLYAIPEMIKDDYNGYLIDPHYWFFDKNNIPNPLVWNHRKKTIYSGKISNEIVSFLEERIIYLYNNRSKLYEMSINSYNKARTAPFSEEYITNQWNELLYKIRN